MSADPFAVAARRQRPRAGCLQARRLGADAAIRRDRGSRLRRHRYRRRRRPADRRPAESGFSVIGFDAGPYFRPLEDFASDEREQEKLYWTDERIVDGANPITMGGKNSGKAVGGSTVHFAMVSLRFRPEWFKSRSAARLWRRLAARLAGHVGLLHQGREGAQHLRSRHAIPGVRSARAIPIAPIELTAPRELLARGAEAMGMTWTADSAGHRLRTARGHRPLCLSRLLPLRLLHQCQAEPVGDFHSARFRAGAEIRDLAMVGRIEMGPDGRATGVHYHREGRWRFQRARNVVVAGYAIETPRLLLAFRHRPVSAWVWPTAPAWSART